MQRSNRWVVVVARNNLDLLQQAIKSFEGQDVEGGVRMLVVDNGSRGDVQAWCHSRPDILTIYFNPQHSVARAWNSALKYLFSLGGSRYVERVLVCNADVVLRPDTWRWLEAEEADFVTGVGSDDPGCLLPLLKEGQPIECGLGTMRVYHHISEYPTPRPEAKRPHPDFSCFMISRWCYELVGPFDERFEGAYAEDSDMHCRMYQLGINAYAIDLPFLHVGGGAQTIKRADPIEQERIAAQAERNRAYFKEKWGFEVGSERYERFFTLAPWLRGAPLDGTSRRE